MRLFISTIISFIASFIFFFFGDFDILFKYLFTVMILDFITGIINAYINKNISSRIGIKGILKKFSFFVVVTISVFIDNILKLNNTLRNVVIYSLIFNEIISILENCSQIGIPLPKMLINSLKVFKEHIDSNEK